MSEIIRVEHLKYVYNPGMPDATTALDDVSFSVEEGDFVGIIGSTGSGKSTLISHFNGINRPTAGRVLVDGKDLWAPGADLPGSSFAYLADEKEGVAYERRPDGMLLRRVKRIERLFDVSVVSDPAYWGTEVNVRSLERYFDNHEDDTYLREIKELRNLINQ